MAVSQTGNITVRFSENVRGVSGRAFTLRTAAGRPVVAVVSYNGRTGIATLNPTRTLAADTRFTVTLNSAIKDSAGLSLRLSRWSFTTGPRPAVTTRGPASNASGVNRLANVTAKFSENVRGVSRTSFTLRTATGRVVAAAVSYNGRTRVATLNPTRALAGRTRYTVFVSSGIKDRAGNPIPAARWNFSTRR